MNKEFEILSRAVIINGDKVLLANVRGKKWYFLPGGHVEFGETATAALVRELEEETTGSTYLIGEPMGFFENIYGDSASARHKITSDIKSLTRKRSVAVWLVTVSGN